MSRQAVAPRYEAVTFDFWNTLMAAPPPGVVRARRIAAVESLLEELGEDPSSAEDAVAATLTEFDAAWKANRQFRLEEAVPHLADRLGLPAGPGTELAGRLRQAVLGDPAADRPAPAPGVDEVLARLADADVRVGIICDVGLAPSTVLRGHLDAHGLLDRFDHWSFSDEVGAYKPDAAIFGHALAGLAVTDPGRAVHIGDLRRTDVAGARAHGMASIRYAGLHDDTTEGPDGDHVVAHHDELHDVLGLERPPG